MGLGISRSNGIAASMLIIDCSTLSVPTLLVIPQRPLLAPLEASGVTVAFHGCPFSPRVSLLYSLSCCDLASITRSVCTTGWVTLISRL